jgi:purine-binding chemotaxis protein CheW
MNQQALAVDEQTSVYSERATAPSQYLTFKIEEEIYAVGILQVKEILRYETLTKVPSTPGSIRGVINLRGAVVPVIDLAVKFGQPESAVTKWTCVVIVEVKLHDEITVMGLMVDSVNQVIELLPDEIEPPPPFGAKVKVDYITGLGKTGKKFVLILDIDEVLSVEEINMAANIENIEQEEVLDESENPDESDGTENSADLSQPQRSEDTAEQEEILCQDGEEKEEDFDKPSINVDEKPEAEEVPDSSSEE